MPTEYFAIETRPDLEDDGLRSLYDYWHALAVAVGGLPSLQSFDPLHLPKLLPSVWIVEVDPITRRFRMRLTGETINAIYGRSIAGQYFRDVFEPADVETIVARYSKALGGPAAFHAGEAVYAAGGRLSVGERLGLPMVGRSGRTDTLLGASVYRSSRDDGESALAPGEPHFHRIRAANHQPVEIAGG